MQLKILVFLPTARNPIRDTSSAPNQMHINSKKDKILNQPQKSNGQKKQNFVERGRRQQIFGFKERMNGREREKGHWDLGGEDKDTQTQSQKMMTCMEYR